MQKKNLEAFEVVLMTIVLLAPVDFATSAETPPTFVWAHSAGGASNETALAVAVDPSGNVLVTGYFNGTIAIGNTNLVSSGAEDIFLAKFDSAGNPVWVRQAGGIGYDEGRGVATDAAGNVYLTGLYQNTASFGPFNVNSAGFSDVYIAKYDPNGNVVWVVSAGGADYDEAHAIAVDPQGNSYITGFFDADASFGSFTLVNHSSSDDIFVAKCSSTGTFLWARQAGGPLDDAGEAIAVDAATNVYVAGAFAGTATFGSTNLTSAGTNDLPDIFLAKYDSNGNALWVRQAGGAGDDHAYGVAADRAGNVSLTGKFASPATFGNTNLIGNGTDIFVARYDTSGNFLWVRRSGGNNAIYGDSGLGIAVDSSGDAFVTGYFSGNASFGITNLLAAGFDDIFCMKYDVAGNLLWVRAAGGLNLDIGYEVAVDTSGSVYLAGFFASSTIAFDGVTLTNAGGRDIFLAKLAPVPVVPPVLSITLSNGLLFLSWPAAATDFMLESTSDLAAAPWSPVTAQSGIFGTNRLLVLPPSDPEAFFRLHRQ